MNKLLTWLGLSFLAVFILSACGDDTKSEEDSTTGNGKMKVVTSFTIIADMTRGIGGD